MFLSLSPCVSAVMQPTGNEILFRAKPIDRALHFVFDGATNLILPFNQMRINSCREKLNTNHKALFNNQFACILSSGDRLLFYYLSAEKDAVKMSCAQNSFFQIKQIISKSRIAIVTNKIENKPSGSC